MFYCENYVAFAFFNALNRYAERYCFDQLYCVDNKLDFCSVFQLTNLMIFNS